MRSGLELPQLFIHILVFTAILSTSFHPSTVAWSLTLFQRLSLYFPPYRHVIWASSSAGKSTFPGLADAFASADKSLGEPSAWRKVHYHLSVLSHWQRRQHAGWGHIAQGGGNSRSGNIKKRKKERKNETDNYSGTTSSNTNLIYLSGIICFLWEVFQLNQNSYWHFWFN